MAVTRELVKYALSPKLLPYRKLIGTHVGADEIFWQTLVLNIPKFAQNVSRQGWYIRWGHGKTDHSPDTLTEGYEEDMLRLRENFLFMRKVNGQDSQQLMNDVDKWIQQGNDAVPGPHEQSQDEPNNIVPCSSVIVANMGSWPTQEEEASVASLPQEGAPLPPPVAAGQPPSAGSALPGSPDKQSWHGTKSRKQLLESYKWYMQNQ
uniref:Uncharacterized protein n=1 Tax=Alexandrium andersonii TaxID=327968 RepID=A0A7S2NJM2_9DINO|mmetsp:Transcript_97324/g.218131  ORF Transcript_97324/g.218131 Transcript_97324/m.218131 type:complete len:206 (+) Transcript_97324:1-618(+)